METNLYTEDYVIVDCFDLLNCYNRFLEPHLGRIALFIDKEPIIMGSILNHLLHYQQKTVFECGFEQYVPTEKLHYFYAVFNQYIQHKLDYIDQEIKNQLIDTYEQKEGFIILIKRLTYHGPVFNHDNPSELY